MKAVFQKLVVPCLFIVFVFSLSQAADVNLEKALQKVLLQDQSTVSRAKDKLKNGLSVAAEINLLKSDSQSIRTLRSQLQDKFRSRAEQLDTLGATARDRHAAIAEGSKKAIDEYLSLIDSLPTNGSVSQATLENIKLFLDRILYKKKKPIIGSLPYRNLNYPSKEPRADPAIKPAYKGGNKAVSPDDTNSTEEAPISEEIATLAQSLNWNPVSIYEYVKNNIETEWYWGCMKGAEETLRQKSGNDCDQATLLVALLRSAGFPSRYVRGTIEFFAQNGRPIEKVKNITGVNEPWKIAEFFQKAGIPYKPIISAGAISNCQIEHIWVESQIPYGNYRGAIIDNSQKIWLGLDTSIKTRGYTYNNAADPFEQQAISSELSVIRDEYLGGGLQTQTPLEYVEAKISALSGQSEDSFEVKRTLVPSVLNILPSSMQFNQINITHEYTAIPDDLKHKITFTATDMNKGQHFTQTIDAMNLSNKEISLSYEPETVEDQEIIDSYGGLDNTPAYLVRLRPVLEVEGDMLVAGNDGLPMGSDYSLTIELISPNGTEKITSTQITGNVAAIGITSGRGGVTPPLQTTITEEDDAETILFKEANSYIDRWNKAEDELASLLHLQITRPLPTVVTVGGVVDMTYLLDMPHGYEWKGVYVDANFRAIEITPSRSPLPQGGEMERKKTFMQLSALQGSILENKIFEDYFGVDSISTAKLFEIANSNQIPILSIDKSNIDTILPMLPFDDDIKTDIANSVNQNSAIRIPQSEITYKDWTGIGYVKEDPGTGEAGYMLSGMIAGGMTAQSPEDWVNKYLAEKLGKPYSGTPDTDPTAAVKIIKVNPTDGQEGIVGQDLKQPLEVLVVDRKSMPVSGVNVTFQILGGGGTIYGNPSYSATTDRNGVAKAPFTLGQQTSSYPIYRKLNPEDAFDTQIGLNIVTASAESSIGNISLDQPFQAYGKPDIPDKIKKVLGDNWSGPVNTTGTSLKAVVADKYGNPISNVPITFSTLAAVSMEPLVPLPANYRNIEFYKKSDCNVPTPVYGECATTIQVTLTTDYFGAVINYIFGNTVNTKYTVQATSPNVQAEQFTVFTQGFRNTNDYIAPGLYINYFVPVNDKGEPVNAARAGTALNVPLVSELFLLYDDYTLDGPHPCSVNATVNCWTLKPSGIVNIKPITDGTVTFTPTQGGGSVVMPVVNLGNGKYQANYITGAVPAVNKIDASGTATITVPQVKLDPMSARCAPQQALPAFEGAVPTNYYYPQCKTAITEYNENALQCANGACKLPDQTVTLKSGQQAVFYLQDPVTGQLISVTGTEQKQTYTVYGVLPVITWKLPDPITLDTDGYLTQDVMIGYSIEPAEYNAVIADIDIFERPLQSTDPKDDVLVYSLAGSAAQGNGMVTLFSGMYFDAGGEYYAQVVLNRGGDTEVKGDKVLLFSTAAAREISFRLERTYYMSQFDPVVQGASGNAYIDEYKPFNFTVNKPSKVTLTVLNTNFDEKGTIVPESHLSAGDYSFVVDYKTVSSFGFDPMSTPKFYLRLKIVPDDGSWPSDNTYPGKLAEKIDGRMLGQTIVHDVLIQDGSLNLSRQDAAFKGRGPQFEFTRSYNNQSSGRGHNPLGGGWGHSLDLRLRVLCSGSNCTGSVPDWVKSLEGKFFTGQDLSSNSEGPTLVQVNGTTFRKYNGQWFAEMGRHGTLQETDGGFIYTSKDGTQYKYASQLMLPWPVQTITDRNGNTMTFSYDTLDRLDTVTDAVRRVFKFEYAYVSTAIGLYGSRLVKVTGPDNFEIDFAYNDKGYLETARRDTRTETYTYTQEPGIIEGEYNLTGAADVYGHSYAYEYYGPSEVDPNLVNFVKVLKSQDVIKKVQYPDGNAAFFQYNVKTGNMRTVTDLRGNNTVYNLNYFGNPNIIQEPLGKVTQMTWSIDEGKSDNVMTSKTDALGNKTTYEYDTKGNITVETDPYGNAVTTSWNQTYSLPENRKDRNGIAQTWQYDTNGDLLLHTDGDGKKTSYTYYPTGEKKTMTDPRGNTTSYTYDQWGNPATVAEPEGSVTTYEFDVRGRRISLTDAKGNKTQYAYDSLDYPRSITHPPITAYTLPTGSGNVQTYEYDPVGNLLSETNKIGLKTTYTYTPRNQVLTITRDIGGEKSFSYDPQGNLLTETDWSGNATTHTYDALSRRVTTTNRLGNSMGMSYDLNGNLTKTTDYEGNVTDYAYDKLDRQTDTWQPPLDGVRGNVHKTYYNEADPKTNLKSEMDQEGNTTSYGYNGRYLRTRRTNALGGLYNWGYDDNGNLLSETDENVHSTTYEYDKQNRRTARHRTVSGKDIVTQYAYDADGNQIQLTDPRGKITKTDYDEWNRAWQATDPDSYVITTEYDGEGNKVKATDGNGNPRTWRRDSLGRVTRATDAEGNSTIYSYDLNNNVLTVTDANGTITKNTYDAEDRLLLTNEAFGTDEARTKQVLSRDKMGNPLQVKDYNGNATTTVYNALYLPWQVYDPAPFDGNFTETTYYKTGKVKTVKNRRGFVTSHEYDALGREVKVTDPKGQTIVTTYDNVGNVKTVTDKRNIVKENSYDEANRLLTTKRANVLILTNEYDNAANITAVIDANGNRIEKTYTNRNLLDTTKFADGTTEKRTYDGVGNLLTLTNEENKVTTYTYDKENRQTSVEFAGEKTVKTYDALGDLATIRKPMGNVRKMEHDKFKRMVTVVDDPASLNLTTRYEYDPNGNLLHQYDARGNDVEFTYDSLNRKTQHIQHKTSGDLTTKYSYDAEGNLISMIDAKGQSFTYTYDELNRRTDETDPIVATPFMTLKGIHTEYDPNNNITGITETKKKSDNSTVTDVTTNTYDNFDRLLTSTERGLLVSYTYDNNGNRTSVSTPAGSTTYTFDKRNRISTAVADALTTTYTYYPDGKKDTISYPNGASVKYTYYPTNRIQNVTNRTGGPVISSYDYAYDFNGNRVSQTEVQNGVTENTTYDYDTLDRLKDFTVTGADTIRTEYTLEGYNRKTEKVTKNGTVTKDQTYTYDETDWLMNIADSVQQSAISYEYDNNGNMIRKADSLLPNGDSTFVYDSRNKLVEAKRGPPGSETILGQYDYNSAGLRIRHRFSERGDVDYYYDEKAVIEEHNANDNSLLAHYRYGDRLISLSTGTDIQYYHFDGLGSTINLTNSVGATDTSYRLDPWGHIRLQIGTSLNTHIFTGKEYDANTGLVYFGARYYDPDTARFITEDSYLGEQGTPPSLNRYLYAYSNPTVYIDLMGYESNESNKYTLIPRFSKFQYDDNILTNILKVPFNAATNTANTVIDLANIPLYNIQYAEKQGIRKYGMDVAETNMQSVKGALKDISDIAKYHATTPVMQQVRDAGEVLKQQAKDAGNALLRAQTWESTATIGMESALLGGPSSAEGLQIMKAAAKDKIQTAVKMTKELADELPEAGQKLIERAKTAYKESPLGNEVGAVGYSSKSLPKKIEELAEEHITDTDITVLGRYHPITKGTGQYIAKAQRIDASYFDLGKTYETLSPAQQKAANFHFLDIIADRGDKVLLSVPKTKIPRGTALWDEIEYLTKNKAYYWVNQWSLRKGGSMK